MQNKNAIRFFAIAFAIVCVYQLSFTWVTSHIEKKAAAYADNYVRKQFPDKISATDEASKQFIENVRAKTEFNYLDSVGGEEVFNLLVKKYTFKECQERTLNLGLDLKGGMNVTLEVNVEDIVRSLSNFSTDPTFLKAIERAKELQKTSKDDFVTLFGKAFEQIDPNAKLAAIYSLPMEMKGKVDFNSTNKQVLAVLSKETNDAIDNSFNILRTRIDKFGVVQPNIQQLGTKGRILVELPGIKDPERVRKLLQGTANLEFWETYENSEVYPSLVEANKKIKELKAGNVMADTSLSAQLIAKKDSVVKKDSTKKQLSLLEKIESDTSKVDSTALPGQTAKDYPLFSILQPNVYENKLAQGPVVGRAVAKDTSLVNTYLSTPQVRSLFKSDVRFYWSMKPMDGDKTESIFELFAIKSKGLDGRAPLDGSVITSARSEFGQNRAEASVSMSMTPEGSKVWARLTKDNIGKCIAIVLDGNVTSAPVVKTEITGGNSEISGHFTINEAGDLAITLKSGKMPARAVIMQEAVVGPSLGEASVKAGLASFIIAFLVVLLYMGFYYNKGGWVANIALLVNVFFIFGILASLNAVLTLPGIAGIVLTLGMAVDANVIIYERIREELRAGKALRNSIADGFHHAYSAIIDGNVTTLLTGIVLFIFGSGPIQGFATTLIIGILTSMFTAIFISRLVFEGMLSGNKHISFSRSFTENILTHVNFDFIGKRKIFYVASGILISLGIVSMFTRGFDLGIDFSGGRNYIVKFDNPVKVGDVQKSLTGAFDGIMPEVKTFGAGGNQVKIATKFMNQATDKANPVADSIVESRLYLGLKPYLGNTSMDGFIGKNLLSSEKVGPTIAGSIKINAVYSVILALIIIFLYIFLRFKNWQFGLGGVISLAHDVLVVLGIYSLLWGFLPFSLEIDQSFIAAILTVIGYSINDSVIIFDRIREYTHLYPKRDRHDVYNAAMNSTLGRTLNTSLTTLFTVIVIFIFGGEVIRGFVFALMIGIGIGTYSSVFNAAPVVFDAFLARDRKKEKKA